MKSRALAVASVLAAALASCGGESDSDGAAGSGGAGATGGSGGLPGDWLSCAAASDCVLRSVSCCGSCGAATRGDALALNLTGMSAYGSQKCASVDCPACFQAQDPTLLATCDAGQCVVIDLQEHPSTACSDVSECRVRGNVCCECGGPTEPPNLVAVGSAGGFETLVCDPGTACPECAPVYPALELACTAGHCAIAP